MKGAHLRLAFFNASRNDPFPSADRVGRGPSVGGGLAEMVLPEGSPVAFACGPGQVAADGRKGGHSPFTKALLDNIAAPGVEIQQAMTQVRSTDLGKHRSRRPGLSQSGRTHREEMKAWREGAKKRCNQQAACQPSGNGIRGQDKSLSLAAFGVLETVGMMKSSSPEAGAIAVRTTSSNTSNSTSLIGAVPHLGSATSQNCFGA